MSRPTSWISAAHTRTAAARAHQRATVAALVAPVERLDAVPCCDCGAVNVVMVAMAPDVRGNPVRLCRPCWSSGIDSPEPAQVDTVRADRDVDAGQLGLEVVP